MSDVVPLERAATFLREAERVLVLTGAGISAESGIPTFRASDGLWENHHIHDVATPEGFERDPKLVWRFYNQRRVQAAGVQPNAAHHALVQLEAHLGDRFCIATQNVDGLHTTAGSRNVLELHGALRRSRCLSCHQVQETGLTDLGAEPHCPHCEGRLRPHIVWFGESLEPWVIDAAQSKALEADVLLVVGTSAVVYPAAGLIPLTHQRSGRRAKGQRGRVIEVNLTSTDASEASDVALHGKAGEVLPRLVERALQR